MPLKDVTNVNKLLTSACCASIAGSFSASYEWIIANVLSFIATVPPSALASFTSWIIVLFLDRVASE